MEPYNYKKCRSLFGYSAGVHVRSGGKCQLCGCGGSPLDFALWRQMTVEHLIGRSDGGYIDQIREAVAERFPNLSQDQKDKLTQQLDRLNTVSACSFCNSTTSHDRSEKGMADLLNETKGNPKELLKAVKHYLKKVLERKRKAVRWKLDSVKQAFENEIRPTIEKSNS